MFKDVLAVLWIFSNVVPPTRHCAGRNSKRVDRPKYNMYITAAGRGRLSKYQRIGIIIHVHRCWPAVSYYFNYDL